MMRKPSQVKQDMIYAKTHQLEANRRWKMNKIIELRQKMGIPVDTSILDLTDEEYLNVVRKIWKEKEGSQ